MRKTLPLAAWLLLALFTGLTGAAQQRPAGAHSRANSPTPTVTDAQIQQNIQQRLAKSKIGKNGFKFSTSHGVTTIEGRANVMQHKGAATRIAKSSGAIRVVNKIEIPEEVKAAARERLASGRRRTQVKRGEVRSQPH